SSSSASSSAMSSPVHPASLVDPALHSTALLELLDLKITRPVIEYLVEVTVETVDYAMDRPATQLRGRALTKRHDRFTTFVTNVLTRAEITFPVVLATLAYIDRSKPHLHIALEEWAHERVFLGALMVASKYLNDSTLKNVHWALCTGVFGKRDVGRIEREFLDVLDFELAVTEDDLLSHHDILTVLTSDRHRHHVHTHKGHHHHRLPALDNESDSSSISSGSPQTPSTLVNSPHVP
ncbi:hypothetical protein FISHEDRAFT_16088, partial [Fistulina hepatica ATCC 64428]